MMFGRAATIGLLVLSACTPTVGSTTSVETSTTATTSVPTTTTTTVAPTSAYLLESATIDGVIPIDIYGPDEVGPWPVVVQFHGGGWFGGDRTSMAPLAEALAESGVVVFNATYRTSNGGYPESFEDVACAIRYAASRASDFTESSAGTTIVAHSAGAQLASVIALAGDHFEGDCPLQGSALPTRFVGLAGPYDVTQLTQVLPSFFGTRYEVDPAPWEDGSAFFHLGQNPELRVLLIHGTADDFVPVEFSKDFGRALQDEGYSVRVEILDGVNHFDVHQPDVVASLIANLIGA
ncbi:MAG: alpha/beta hydrolase [Acidimicrobiia bacterium]